MIDALSGLAFLLGALAICAYAGAEVTKAKGARLMSWGFVSLGSCLVLGALGCIAAGAILGALGYMHPSTLYH